MAPKLRWWIAAASLVLLAGCTGPGGGPAYEASPTTITPGASGATALVLGEDAGGFDQVEVAEDDGLDVDVKLPADGGNASAVWVVVTAPEDAEEGEHGVLLDVDPKDGEPAQARVPVEVATPEDPLGSGEVANLTLSALTLDGQLAYTNDEAVANASLPKAPGYQDLGTYRPIPAPVGERAAQQSQLPVQLLGALNGTGVGHSLYVEVPDAFGPEFQNSTQPREETVDRTLETQASIELPPQQAQRFVSPNAQEGDEVRLPLAGPQAPGIPYVLVNKTQQSLGFELAAEEGGALTLYEAWPDATVVDAIDNGTATLNTTPPDEEGNLLTWNQDWGKTTELVSVNATTITLRHGPEEGITYVQTDQRSGQTINTTVVEVTEDEIVLQQENPHPLGGETLGFAVTVEDKAQPQQPTVGPS
jgi:FKBP-type peptidyl-prolyl cis-trans isomerase 2